MHITKYNIFSLLSVFIFFIWVLPVQAKEPFTAQIVKVTDGDTVTVLTDDDKRLTVRLYGIDAPEIRQAYGKRAREALKRLIGDKRVTIKPVHTDRYGRTVAIIEYGQRKIKNANVGMVLRGYAWKYDQYCKSYEVCQQIEIAQQWAQSNKKGLWRSKKAKEPWLYRKRSN